MKPDISIVMPVFNREDTVARAIDSVLAQTFKNFELILVDDASTDSTPDILTRYQRLDTRVRVVRNEMNSRLAAEEWEPRNDGLKVAAGEYIAYLDADNEWHSSFLKVMGKAVSEKPEIVLAHCDSLNFYRTGELKHLLLNDPRTLVYAGIDCAVFSHNGFDQRFFGSAIYVDTNEMLHRREVFLRLGGFWRTIHPDRERIQVYQGNKFPYRRHNDLDLFERIFEHFGPNAIRHVHQILVRFIYPGAATVDLYGDDVIDTLNKWLY